MVEEYCWLATLQAGTSKTRVHSGAALVRSSCRLQLHVLHAAPVLRLAAQPPTAMLLLSSTSPMNSSARMLTC